MYILDKNINFKNLESILNKLGVSLVAYKKLIRDNWDYETVYYLENGNLSEKKRAEFEEMKNPERFFKGRSLESYCLNLIKGWVVEDIAFYILNLYTCVEFSNQDKERKINTKNAFKLIELDFIDTLDNRNIDAMSCFTGYCKRNSSLSLSFEKIGKFQDDDTICIIDFKNESIAFLKPSKLDHKRIVTNIKKNFYKNELDFKDYNSVFVDIELIADNKDIFDSMYY